MLTVAIDPVGSFCFPAVAVGKISVVFVWWLMMIKSVELDRTVL
jgi:hypothetical protein